VSFLQNVPDGQLRWLYSNAQALLAVGLEDFGLTPIEAATFGTPTIARAFGGYLDTVTEGTNGLFLKGLDPSDFRRALELLRAEPLSPDVVSASAERFSEIEFAKRINEVVNRVCW
jgi:glycosyltransferase involved in cell wall biosynthesis